jgi:hypothetical protein
MRNAVTQDRVAGPSLFGRDIFTREPSIHDQQRRNDKKCEVGRVVAGVEAHDLRDGPQVSEDSECRCQATDDKTPVLSAAQKDKRRQVELASGQERQHQQLGMPDLAIPFVCVPALHIEAERKRRVKVQLANKECKHDSGKEDTKQSCDAPS